MCDGTKKAEAASTCGAVTGTEDAILLPDHARYPGIPIELTHKRDDTGIKNTTEHDASKRPTGGRCINTLATRISNSPEADWAYILSGFADTYRFALRGRWSCAGNV